MKALSPAYFTLTGVSCLKRTQKNYQAQSYSSAVLVNIMVRFQPSGYYRLGVDVGSTTAKLALTSADGTIIYSDYRRHRAEIQNILTDMISLLSENIGDINVIPVFTGSAGMGIAERLDLPFTQEMVAAAEVVQFQYPKCRVLIDIGGEDSKMIFFNDQSRPDMRMNGNCAGGTGAFIDQMASLLDVTSTQFDQLAQQGSNIFPIASRCGVFAKTDVQNLINTGATKTDICLSVFRAVALQVVNTLSRGRAVQSPTVFVGGPLNFFVSLRQAFMEILSLGDEEIILPEYSTIYPAYGAALSFEPDGSSTCLLSHIIDLLKEKGSALQIGGQHPKLFFTEQEKSVWERRKKQHRVNFVSFSCLKTKPYYLGIDAGSTTTKIVAIDDNDQILFLHYSDNQGDPILSVEKGLRKLKQELDQNNISTDPVRSGVTGYGEELIRAAFAIDEGLVETIAHYMAAKKFDPEVSFILDIGGQDMKAIFISDGIIQNIEVNEACSSGCGSFFETFADSLGYSAAAFADIACSASSPVDLGSRCTVFMNSCVKQALRQGSEVADVAAGLAYAIVDNCLNKVLKISDSSVLGDRIVVQGGTFKNHAVLRAFENNLGVSVVCPDIAEYMGAYGVALAARQGDFRKGRSINNTSPVFSNLNCTKKMLKSSIECKSCTNNCRIRKMEFPNGQTYHTGNRCERIFTNSDHSVTPGHNHYARKLELLLSYPIDRVEDSIVSVGLPFVLNLYENYPFWATLFSQLGFKVIPSFIKAGVHQKDSAATIMSDNICYPAKLVHEHIFHLIAQKVDVIFFPRVVYEFPQFDDSASHFNCPVVSGYPDIIESAISPDMHGVAMDSPVINFHDELLLKNGCRGYLSRYNISESSFKIAFNAALKATANYKKDLLDSGMATISTARHDNETMIVLAGRPYHADPMINHTIPDVISQMGAHVLTEDSLPLEDLNLSGSLEVADQWEYSNRLYRAAHWVGRESNALFIQLNSFGCGPDAVTIDEVKEILKTYQKKSTLLKIDEISSVGSAKLRIRSLLESRVKQSQQKKYQPRQSLPCFQKEDRERTVLVPSFSPFYSFFVQSAFQRMGYKFKILPQPDKESVRLGLKYSNNDICYPATITIGDVIKALESGKHKATDIAVAFTETGGQCRATNYVSLLKKALLKAGFHDIPVVSVSFNKDSANNQPGFSLNRPQLISMLFSGLLVVDQLIKMYHATAVREMVAGESLELLKTHLDETRNHLGNWNVKKGREILIKAISDFNKVSTKSGKYPKVGVVGEIYVKYNPFSNGDMIRQLMDEGFEISTPPLLPFFMQTTVNIQFNHFSHIERSSLIARKSLLLLQKLVDAKVSKTNKMMSQFKLPVMPTHTANELAIKAEKVINLSNQAGEGWLLPSEVVAMAEAGINNIISLQPFGCIANHIVAKGVANKFLKLYPDLNFLPLDMDSGNSNVNIQNRLAFFIHSTKTMASEQVGRKNKVRCSTDFSKVN